MKGDERIYGNLDQMIDDALGEVPAGHVPNDIASKVLVRIDQVPVIRELAFESTLKLSLVIGVFVVLVTSLLLFGIADVNTLEAFIEKNRMILFPALFMILFTWLFNDIVLKYLFRKSEPKGSRSWQA